MGDAPLYLGRSEACKLIAPLMGIEINTSGRILNATTIKISGSKFFMIFMIIFISGMYDGMRSHAKQVTIDTEVAGGAYWHPKYDPYDAITFENSTLNELALTV